MRALLLASVLIALTVAGVNAHNGSIIDWVVANDEIRASYSSPKPGMAQAGIRPGTLLFSGHYLGNKITGTAYAFKVGCAPRQYEVTGAEDKDNTIVLRGPAPRWDGCELRDYSLSIPNAILVFTYSGTRR